jgi:AcrR family transcriptional regulator
VPETDRNARGENGADRVRHAELLKIAAELFAERGYAATTVRSIGQAAGMLSGSLYHHFESKESMIDEILWSFIDRTLAAYEQVLAEELSPRLSFEQLLRVSLDSVVVDRSAILIYQNEARFLAEHPRFSYLREAHSRFESIWTGVVQRGIDEGEFRSSTEPKLVYRLVRDSIWTAPRWWRPNGPLGPMRIVEQYLAVLLDGIPRRPS